MLKRTGSSLVELLVALGLAGVVLVAATGSMLRQQRAARIHGAANRVVGGIEPELVGIAGCAELVGEMDVAVDQSGQAGLVDEIVDALYARRDGRSPGMHGFDPLTADDDRRLAEQLSARRIEKMPAVEDDRRKRTRPLVLGAGAGRQQAGKQ